MKDEFYCSVPKNKIRIVDTPKIRAVSLIIAFTEYDTKKIHPEAWNSQRITGMKVTEEALEQHYLKVHQEVGSMFR